MFSISSQSVGFSFKIDLNCSIFQPDVVKYRTDSTREVKHDKAVGKSI